MPEEILETPQPTQSTEPKSPNWPKVILAAVLGFGFLAGAASAGYWYGTESAKQPASPAGGQPKTQLTPSPTPEASPTYVPTPPSVSEGIADGKLFYPKDNNIFSYDVKTGKTERWTNYPKNKDYSPAYDESGKQIPNIGIYDIRVIDESTLGFGKCGTVTGNFGCGLYLLDLETKEITQRVELDKEDLLLGSGWFDRNRVAYLVNTKKNNGRWRLYLVNNNNANILVDLSTEGYGRGGFIEDSSKIEFSPDGTYFFHIATSSPRSAMDFTTYIYNASTGETAAVIGKSTQPDWLDDQRVVFRKYDSEDSSGNGLYFITLPRGASIPTDVPTTTAYHPEVLPDTNKILYENNPEKQLWLYNISSKENKLIAGNALSGLWLSPTIIVYNEVASCSEGEACGMVDYKIVAVGLYDLELNRKIGSIPDLQSVYGASSLYR